MKALTVILFILSFATSKSQLPFGVVDASLLASDKFEWENIRQNIEEEDEENFLIQLYEYDSTAYAHRKEEGRFGDFNKFTKSHANNIHFVDLDKDGDADVVYDGVAGGYEMGFLDFYQNDNGVLKLGLHELGRAYFANLLTGEFGIQKYPCCDQKLNILRSIKLNSETWKVINSDSIEVYIGRGESMGDSILPPSIHRGFPLEIVETVELRWSPSMTDSDMMETCENSNSNIISHLPSGTKGEILWVSEDSRWMFVRILNTKNLENYCKGWGKEIDQATSVNTYGWIRK